MSEINFARAFCSADPARSLWADGVPLALCGRCTGIYIGVLVAFLIFWFEPPAKKRASPDATTFTRLKPWLLLGGAAAAMPIEIVIGRISLPALVLTRYYTGTFFGGAAAGMLCAMYRRFVTTPAEHATSISNQPVATEKWKRMNALNMSSSLAILVWCAVLSIIGYFPIAEFRIPLQYFSLAGLVSAWLAANYAVARSIRFCSTRARVATATAGMFAMEYLVLAAVTP